MIIRTDCVYMKNGTVSLWLFSVLNYFRSLDYVMTSSLFSIYRFLQPLKHLGNPVCTGSKELQMLWDNFFGYLRYITKFSSFVLSELHLVEIIKLTPILILVGCQDQKCWEHSNFGRGSHLQNELYGLCAGNKFHLERSFSLMLLVFILYFENLIVCCDWTQNHIDRNADVSISCAPVGDRSYRHPFYLLIFLFNN